MYVSLSQDAVETHAHKPLPHEHQRQSSAYRPRSCWFRNKDNSGSNCANMLSCQTAPLSTWRPPADIPAVKTDANKQTNKQRTKRHKNTWLCCYCHGPDARKFLLVRGVCSHNPLRLDARSHYVVSVDSFSLTQLALCTGRRTRTRRRAKG